MNQNNIHYYLVFSFEQNWSIANTGTEAWPGSCRLIQAGGEPLGATPQYVPPLPPGHSTTVTMKLVAPSSPGTHRGYFHLVTDKGDQIGGNSKMIALLLFLLLLLHVTIFIMIIMN